MLKAIDKCRICGNTELVAVIDLGIQYLTGVFPRSSNPDSLTSGPLQVVKCHGSEYVCGLVQLRHSYQASEMYGDGYGYRSGLNQSMVQHLRSKVKKIEAAVPLVATDLVIDIGSNDGTTLGAFQRGPRLIGIDPSALKFASIYPDDAEVIADFFSERAILDASDGQLAKVITSFAMMYDLEDPISFTKEVASVLAPDGVWVFEQSYMPLMIEHLAYDTICHEHIEYFGLRQINWILREAALKIVDVELNEINGGSFSVTAAHLSSPIKPNASVINSLLERETKQGYNGLAVFDEFARQVRDSRDSMVSIISGLRAGGKRICGLGASTKGNVLLQYAQLDSASVEVIGDVNPDKHGCFTPGSWIPIVSEEQVLDSRPDYLLVLPWHFKSFFISSERFIGHQLMFPLPKFEIIPR